MVACIWCKQVHGQPSKEHIIPEALGCSDNFTLNGSIVCKKCNNGLAHLDQAVIDEFDFICFHYNIPRKKGRPPKIHNRGNVIGTVKNNHAEITFNMENYSVLGHDANKLGGFKNSRRNINADLSIRGKEGTVTFTASFGDNPKFIRGIVKIGFSVLAYYMGFALVSSDRFDAIRNFVISGVGQRTIFLMPAEGGYVNQIYPPYQLKNGEFGVVFRIGVIEFAVDLSRDQLLTYLLKEKAYKEYGDAGWTFLPPISR